MILFVLFILALTVWGLRKRKPLTTGTITMVTGALKTGKSMMAVWLAIKAYYMALAKWHVMHLLPNHRHDEKPLLYSNIPLKVKHVPITRDILLRKQRIAYKSVMLLDEVSLVADSQLIKDADINTQLLLFYKLYAHMTHGGTLIMDTQSIEDNHYSAKRCTSQYLYIERSIKWLPFVVVSKVLTCRYSSDGSVVSIDDGDIAEKTKWCILPKFVWKLYDCYCYSIFTDHKPVAVGEQKAESLKATSLPTFRRDFDPAKELKNDKK